MNNNQHDNAEEESYDEDYQYEVEIDEDDDDDDDNEEEDDDDDDDDEGYVDAEEEEDEEEEEEEQEEDPIFGGALGGIQLIRILRELARNRLPNHYGYDDPSRSARSPSPIPEPDSDKGKELINSGEFGRVDSAYIPTVENTKKNLVRKLWMRQLKPRSVNHLTLGESILPDKPGKVIDRFESAAYSGQYSTDGSLFAASDQSWNLHVYKTAGNRLIHEKLINCQQGRWTITDHNLSLNRHWLIYSSINPYVYLTRTAADAPNEHHLLDFSSADCDARLWSVRFSGDGREVVGGGSKRVYVYDIESRTVLHAVDAHENDVNSVCFSEPSSSQVLFSGSDDGLIKVW
ncbi:hypothetical protein BGZ76_000321 [Entomortierella beljakovae]|nr:hypothetical protein BGZ76_000321 [Entomortierella beljakovae]